MFYIVQKLLQLTAMIDWLALQIKLINWNHNN